MIRIHKINGKIPELCTRCGDPTRHIYKWGDTNRNYWQLPVCPNCGAVWNKKHTKLLRLKREAEDDSIALRSENNKHRKTKLFYFYGTETWLRAYSKDQIWFRMRGTFGYSRHFLDRHCQTFEDRPVFRVDVELTK